MRDELPAEARLLFSCATDERPDAARQEAMRALIGPTFDWPRFERLAMCHGMVPLASRSLDRIGAPAVPERVLQSLWMRRGVIGNRNRTMTAELLRLLGCFEAHGIGAVAHKGPMLALALHGDVGMRQFGDLDIIVRPRDLLAAKALLLESGYAPQHEIGPELEAALAGSNWFYELALVDPLRDIVVELHWRAGPDSLVVAPGDERWWSGLDTLTVDGVPVRVLPARELLPVLCVHGTKHLWASAGWLADVAALMAVEPRPDWDWILDVVRRAGCSRRVALGLHLVHELMGVAPPEEFARLARHRAVRAVVAEIVPRLLDVERDAPGGIAAARLGLTLHERWDTRASHFLRAVFTPGPGEWQRWRLPRPLFFLYVPLRLVRLAAKYLLRIPGRELQP